MTSALIKGGSMKSSPHHPMPHGHGHQLLAVMTAQPLCHAGKGFGVPESPRARFQLGLREYLSLAVLGLEARRGPQALDRSPSPP